MREGAIYVLDANVFIEAAKRYYAFDIVPAFWRALTDHASDGRLLSIDRVRRELQRQKDELAQWASSAFQPWFAPSNQNDVTQAYSQIMEWAQAQEKFRDGAKADFASAEHADAWVVAYARARDCVVVTHELFDAKTRKEIKIPNVCQAFSVQWVDTFQMLRELRVRLG
jgi:hypothetical protein